MKKDLLIIATASALLAANGAVAGGTRWSSAYGISPLLQPDPTRGSQLNDLAVNGTGQGLAAWDQFSYSGGGSASIGVAERSGRKWSTPFTISGTTGFSIAPRVAVGPDGTMAVSWTYQDPATLPAPQQKVQVALKSGGSPTWITTTLAQGPLGGVALTQFVPVGIDANGNITACWSLWNGTRHEVQAAIKQAGGSWSTPVAVAPGMDGLYANLAVNPRGDAAVVYSMSPNSSYATGTAAQYVFRSGPTGTWMPPVTISETLPSTVGYVTSPVAVLDANGLATIAYLGYGVEATRQLTPGSWTTPQTILATPNALSSFTSFDLAMDQNGNAIAAASIFDATINVDRASIWATVGAPNGVWTQQQRLTDPSVPVDAYAARVAVSPDGNLALAGWIDHYHGTVQVARLINGAWSGASTIGRGTAWASFQETLSLDAGSGTIAGGIWKNAKNGTQIMAVSYGP